MALPPSRAPAAVIRPAAAADAPALAAIHREARRAAMPWLPERHGPAETAAWVASVIGRARVEVATAGEGGAALGFLALADGWVEQLYLRPVVWRRGLGTGLLDRAKAASPGGLRLYAFAANLGARAFYERAGFGATAFGDGSGNEEAIPDVLYAWEPRGEVRAAASPDPG